jgi:hypothetical protein
VKPNCFQMPPNNFFFFDKSIEYIKSTKGRNPWYTESIQRRQKGKGEEREEKMKKTQSSSSIPTTLRHN